MYKSFLKRIFDFIIAVIIFLLVSPIIIILYFFIKLDMGSPIFFKQKRIGKKMKEFKIIKFRTMKSKINSLEKDSERITKLGYFLRKTSLDELPQLLNIIKGDMSFIGPRPLLPEYNNFYHDYELNRFDVNPGMSGYAEVKGRHKIDWDKQFEYDSYYSENLNFILDLKIFLATIPKVLNISKVSSLSRENKRLDIVRRK